jgi:trk system potassium uptake protein TrkA
MQKDTLYAVFGLGEFGREICKVLSDRGAKIVAVDRDQKLVDRVKDMVSSAVLLDSTDEDALRNVGLHDVDVAVVAMGDSVDGSILTTVLLKNVGVPYIIARSISAVHGQVLKQVGATEVINIAVEQGKRIANKILSPDMAETIPISEDLSLAEVRIPSKFIDKSLKDIDLRKIYKVNLVSVKRVETEIDDLGNPEKKEKVFTPEPDDRLKADDRLVILGRESNIQSLKEK